ncbi:AI-2E family transporter [Microbacteriaceae bacterium K1510]|nr:AI-2E family transporter [Microbacteriaceae bacterium K1510]
MDVKSPAKAYRSDTAEDAERGAADGFWPTAAQVAVIGIFVLLFCAFLQLARFLLLPITAAVVIGILLGPISDRASARGVPQPLSALVLVLLLIGVLNILVVVLAAPVSDWVGKAPEIGARLKDKLWLLDYPMQVLRDLRDLLNPGGDHSAPLDLGVSNLIQPALNLLTPAIGFVTPAIGQMLIFLGTLFFFLSARMQLRRGLVMLLPNGEARLRGLRVIHDAESNLTAYFATVAVIYFCDGLLVGIAAYFIGLPNAVAWGALTFVLSFIPYIGPGAVVLILFGVGVIHFPSVTHALIAPAFYIVLATVEGNFITPAVVGRRLTLTPLAVFLSLVFWAWLWGPIGAFLATPLLTIGLVIAGQLFPHEKPALPA